MQERRLPDRRELHGDELRAVTGGRPRALLAAGLLLAGAPPALADGAFPDSTRLFLPADRPQQMILATNFGLVVSDDGGDAAWSWACELPASRDASGYQLGPAPEHRVFAVAGNGAAISTDDLGCSWTVASTVPAGARAVDVFPDPASGRRVFAAVVRGADAIEHLLLASADGGRTFDTLLYRPPPMAAIMGVESARSRPDTVYVTLRQGPGTHPRIVRTRDGGQSWQSFDPEAVTGAFDLRIIAVDAANPNQVFFRVRGYPDETLAVSDDGGQTVRIVARIPRGVLSAFGRRADGTALLAGVTSTGGVVLSAPALDGAWSPWARSPLARDFAERAGTLYVVGDDLRDGFAIATSSAVPEDGTTLRPLMRFRDVARIRACVARACATACAFEVGRGNLAARTCDQPTPPAPPDAGAADASVDEPGAAGCSCATPVPRGAPAAPLVAGALWLGWRALRSNARAGRAHGDRRGAGS
jgi:photosystem II stability/assembly factor-like uncharacterized protein